MSADRTYRIRVETVADGAAVEETAKDMDNLGEKTGEASKLAESAHGTQIGQEAAKSENPALSYA